MSHGRFLTRSWGNLEQTGFGFSSEVLLSQKLVRRDIECLILKTEGWYSFNRLALLKVAGIDMRNTGWHEQTIRVALALMCQEKENEMIAQWQWESTEVGKQEVFQLFLRLWFIIQFNFRMLFLFRSLFFFFLRRKLIWTPQFCFPANVHKIWVRLCLLES